MSTAEKIEKRRRICANLMGQGYGAYQIHELHGDEWGVNAGTVAHYCRTIRNRWRAEALSDDRKLDRDVIRQMLLQTIRTAHDLKDTVQVGEHKYQWVSRPDLRSALAAIRMLCDLDGIGPETAADGVRTPEMYVAILAASYGISEERMAPIRVALAAMNGAGKAARLPKGTGR